MSVVYVVLLGALTFSQGTPRSQGKLFLSPLFSESLDRVELNSSLRVKSYAGYHKVNETFNYTFSYFPSIKNAKTAPVLVWLQGEHWNSSLNTWALNHHVIYIDNLVDFDFITKDKSGYTQVADQLYSSLIQFFQIFPKLKNNSFFIAGESYASKYVPVLAHTIHLSNPKAKTEINLQGIVIGNECTRELKHQLDLRHFLHQKGWIDIVDGKVKKLELKTVDRIKNREWFQPLQDYADDRDNDYVIEDIDYNYSEYFKFVGKSSVREVREQQFDEASDLYLSIIDGLHEDFIQSVAPMVLDLLEHYSVTTYSGETDFQLWYGVKLDYLRALPFSGTEEYACAPQLKWRVNGTLAGYVRSAKAITTSDTSAKRGKKVPAGFTEVLILGDGKMLPEDQAWAHDLITRATHGIQFHLATDGPH